MTGSVSDLNRHFGFIAVASWCSRIPEQEPAITEDNIKRHERAAVPISLLADVENWVSVSVAPKLLFLS